jgi:NAD(P)H-dependent FMN reductase
MWVLLIGVSGIVAHAQPAQASLREVAAFLGAVRLPEGSSLFRLTLAAPYQKFAKTMQHDWAHFERVTANPMRQ